MYSVRKVILQKIKKHIWVPLGDNDLHFVAFCILKCYFLTFNTDTNLTNRTGSF